jgi:hypothetical protein
MTGPSHGATSPSLSPLSPLPSPLRAQSPAWTQGIPHLLAVGSRCNYKLRHFLLYVVFGGCKKRLSNHVKDARPSRDTSTNPQPRLHNPPPPSKAPWRATSAAQSNQGCLGGHISDRTQPMVLGVPHQRSTATKAPRRATSAAQRNLTCRRMPCR